ncbi:hypothetical protein B0T13DRAFT_205448 [Neurospora crassa]|nr:hypothetical protein B0T13DRAFT_205448 [Neurospora crassa]
MAMSGIWPGQGAAVRHWLSTSHFLSFIIVFIIHRSYVQLLTWRGFGFSLAISVLLELLFPGYIVFLRSIWGITSIMLHQGLFRSQSVNGT